MLISMILVIGMSLSLGTGVGAGFITLIQGDWLTLIGGVVFLFAYFSLGSARALERGRLPRLMQSGLVASLISFSGCLLIILYGFRFSPEVIEFLSRLVAGGKEEVALGDPDFLDGALVDAGRVMILLGFDQESPRTR